MSLHLVRHGKAGSRPDWGQPDELRPLTGNGRRQALGLADLLAGEPVKRILSSRYVRCVQTVAPLAERLGLEVEQHAALAEEADIESTWSLLEELAGSDVVACTHGNVIPGVLDRIHRRGGELVADDGWACAKGSVWTLEADPAGAFTRARYTPPSP